MLLFSGNYHNETCSVFVSSQPLCCLSFSSPFFLFVPALMHFFISHTNIPPLCLCSLHPSPDPITLFMSNYTSLPSVLVPPEVPVSSVLCLSSVRELPVQVRELYAQGFVLVAVHPFVHPCGPRHARIQRQLHRAVLVRETPRYPNRTHPPLPSAPSL